MRIRFKVPTGKTELWTTDSDSVLIGRQLPPSPAHLDLRDVKVSGRHARLTFEDGAYFIEDLGSTNGTWIGRKRIKDRVRLDAGAEVRIGETTLLVEGIVDPPGPGLGAARGRLRFRGRARRPAARGRRRPPAYAGDVPRRRFARGRQAPAGVGL